MLLDINKSHFGTPAVGYNHEYIDSFDSSIEVEYNAKGTRNEYVYNDFGMIGTADSGQDYDIAFTLVQGSRENGKFDDVQYMTLDIIQKEYKFYSLVRASLNFKVLRSPKRSDSNGFNNHILFNDIIFKTPTELLAYIMEQYFGFEVDLRKHRTEDWDLVDGDLVIAKFEKNSTIRKHSKFYVHVKAME